MKKNQECVVCDGRGASLCRACQRDYDKATEADDGTIMATIRWAAKRTSAKSEKLTARKRDQITLVAAYLHAAYLQGAQHETEALSKEGAVAQWRKLRSRRAKSAWLRDAEALLREAGVL